MIVEMKKNYNRYIIQVPGISLLNVSDIQHMKIHVVTKCLCTICIFSVDIFYNCL